MARTPKPALRKTPHKPKLGKHVFIDSSAQVIGQVSLADHASVWPGCVLRGDIARISVGKYSNIQDLSVLHVETDGACRVGDFVTVGHRVILHACTVKSEVLVGMGSIVLDGAVIGTQTILGAGSLVTQNQKLKPRALYFGNPAKYIRPLTKKEIASLKPWAKRYAGYARDHQTQKFKRL